MVLGSRGDLQPFLEIGKVLYSKYGHRVRIATHPRLADLVKQTNVLEFYSVGGDPAELVAYRLQDFRTRLKDFQRIRRMLSHIFRGFWEACIMPSNAEKDALPFVADAIIATPPCNAHIHCAQRLSIPLHLMFTNSRSPTVEIPHPMANGWTDHLQPNPRLWLAQGSLLNNLRTDSIGLPAIPQIFAASQFYRLCIPHTYLWATTLLSKPSDWGAEIDVVGFVASDASHYQAPKSLLDFLDAGETPVYIGFGSMVPPHSSGPGDLIVEAITRAKVRAIISKGWSNLDIPEDCRESIYIIDEVPHEWLFHHVSVVVHHGGPGTTAAGLKYGRPTVTIPFCGDQFFWGARIAEAGAGAGRSLPYKSLTAEDLVAAIQEALRPEAFARAAEIAKAMSGEWKGAEKAAESFHQRLSLNSRRCCDILEDRLAIFREKATGREISALAAYSLVSTGDIDRDGLVPVQQVEWIWPKLPFEGLFQATLGLRNFIWNLFTFLGRLVLGFGDSWSYEQKPPALEEYYVRNVRLQQGKADLEEAAKNEIVEVKSLEAQISVRWNTLLSHRTEHNLAGRMPQ
ncbi:MAG: hypothetical protein Q9227_006757 [Pyrenula ochraceoflavens]